MKSAQQASVSGIKIDVDCQYRVAIKLISNAGSNMIIATRELAEVVCLWSVC